MDARPAERGDFTKQAAAYAKSRPGYPPALLDELIDHAGVCCGDPVADIGAGSGQLTRQIAERGFQVTAVEPNEAMRSHAPSMNGVTWVDGTFEQTGLADASQVWATAAQSFHWADRPRALPELRRILRPGGHVTVMWNNRLNERSEVLRETIAIINQFDVDVVGPYRDRQWGEELTSTGDFVDLTYHEAEHVQTMSADDYPLLWLSRNRMSVALGEEGCQRVAQRIAEYLQRQHLAAVEIPYVTHAWTAQRI